MRRIFFYMLALVFLSGIGFAQTTATVSGHISAPNTVATTSQTQVIFELTNTGGQLCKVSGTTLVMPYFQTFSPQQILAGVTLYRNDAISCGTTTGGSRWKYTIKYGSASPNASVPQSVSCVLNIASSSINLDSTACLNAAPTPVVAVPTDALYARLDGTNAGFTGDLTFNGHNLSGLGNVSVGGTLGAAQVNKTVVLDGVTNTTFAQAVAATPSGGTLFIPANTSVALSGSVARASNIWVVCGNRATSVITAPSGAAIFTLSGTINQFHLIGCTWIGNGAGSKVADFTGVVASEGRLSLEDNIFSTFGGDVFTFPASVYMVNIEKNTFVNNSGGVTYTGSSSDSWIRDNFFENVQGTGSALTLIGPNVHVVGNTFVPGGAVPTTGPDILINPINNTASSTAYIWLVDNKHGNDGGDSATRFKVQINNPTTTFSAGRIVFRGNNYFGVAGQSAIRIDNCTRSMEIVGNYFSNFGQTGTAIDDNYTTCNASWGQSTVGVNYFQTDAIPPSLFKNGGRGFWRVDVPENAAQLPIYHSQHETPELRNRVQKSEDCSTATWVKSGIVCTTGIADPLGTTRANQLNGSGNVSVGVDNTGMGTHFNVRVWLQAGTVTAVRMGVKDNTIPAFQMLPEFVLSSTWKEYNFDIWGVVAGHSFSFFIFEDTSGTVNMFAPMISDWGGDYLPNPNTGGASDTTSGERLEKKVRLGASSGIVQEGSTSGTVSTVVPATAGTVNMTYLPISSGPVAKAFVTSDFTTANNTSLQTITGLSFTVAASAVNYNFHCALSYSQATAAVADAFGIQAATNAPTNIFATGQVFTAAGTATSGTLATLSTTTATNIVTFTPGATATNNVAYLDGTIENPASANTFNIMVSTTTGADAATVKRGSYCELF